MGGCIATKTDQHSLIFFTKAQFTFKEVVGVGAFGKVWKAIHKVSGKAYAVKVMSKRRIMSKKCIKSVLLQKKIHEYLSQWGCELIVNMIASSQDRQKLYLVMQYIDGCNLRTHMLAGLTLPETQIKYLIFQLLKSLQFVHQKCVIHGDIKPENIIIDGRGKPRIMDFGLSNCYYKYNSQQTGGTLAYKTPEVLLQRNHTYSVDHYALGIITYELFFKRRPHVQTGVAELKKQILTKSVNPSTCPELSTISKDAADFIEKLLQLNPENRLGFTSQSQIFNHPWIKTEPNSSDHIPTDKTHYLQSLSSSRLKPQFTAFENDSEEDNVESVKNLLDRQHIQKKFEGFSEPLMKSFPILTRPSMNQQLAQNMQSLTSIQIRLQLRKTTQY